MATKTISTDDPGAKPEVWSSETLPPHRQFEAWRELVVDALLSWDIPKITCERFPAHNVVVRSERTLKSKAWADLAGILRDVWEVLDSAAEFRVGQRAADPACRPPKSPRC